LLLMSTVINSDDTVASLMTSCVRLSGYSVIKVLSTLQFRNGHLSKVVCECQRNKHHCSTDGNVHPYRITLSCCNDYSVNVFILLWKGIHLTLCTILFKTVKSEVR